MKEIKGLCECGCGETTNLAKASWASRGWVKGEPMRFLNNHHNKLPEYREAASKRVRGKRHPFYGKTGSESSNWKGGVSMCGGYRLLYAPDHPNCNVNNYVFEHRLVMEEVLGRYLTAEEVVHHIDGVKSNNAPENLMLFPNNAAHTRWHWENDWGNSQ
jgi:hypothetical protein